MSMVPKILFSHQQAAITGPTQVTSGPASGKQWVIKSLKITCYGAGGECLLTHGISGTDYIIHPAVTMTIHTTDDVGPVVMDNGNDMDATSTTASATFDIVAYGYERDTA